jgi:peptide-methionine (S)-S-oxide reductase
MKRLSAWLFAAFAALCLALSTPVAAADAKSLQTAVFAGGCFWCMESDMKAVPGVVAVQSGYTGGTLADPHYSDVITERTGHYESVKVTFDPARLSYQQLLARYWKLVDPTDDGGQFCDRGPSYRPAVFVSGPEQRKIAEASRAYAATQLKSGQMTAQILPLGPFWPSEEEHRDYAARHKLAYELYRQGCGRDARLSQVWGRAG